MTQQDGGSGVQSIGPSGRVAAYRVADGDMATGSTLGGPKVCTVIKATGAIEKVFSIDLGEDVFGTLVLHHWDEQTGMHLDALDGTFTLHPEHQERDFHFSNGVSVHEDIFVLNGVPGADGAVDPPATYYTVELRNGGAETARIATYAFCQMGGMTTEEIGKDIEARYDDGLGAIIAWDQSSPDHARVFGCFPKPDSAQTAFDHALTVSEDCPGALADDGTKAASDPVSALHCSHTLAPGESARFYYLLSFSADGREAATQTYRSCPSADEALERTTRHYHEVLDRSTVLTPNPQINHGVLWAKANMLRTEIKPPMGWSFTNNPTKSSNCVARDTSWFCFGTDYITPHFSRELLRSFVRHQESSGMIVEFYNMLTGKTTDDGMNINDDTPLLILALWHHYALSGDEGFLREVYPAAARAARYILSQRNAQGLVWCTADGQGGKGIIGWRNALEGYRLSGATTEVNAECYAALQRVATMAELLGKQEERAEFADQAAALKEAINTHLYNPKNGLYYLNIDVDGNPRGDVTTDLVFPVMFDVADQETSLRVIQRLSSRDFWTPAGLRVVPRDAPSYSPDQGSGLLGGVWVAVTFWFAFAAARFSPKFMDLGLSTTFENYARDPRQSNTVPGQFSEWLDGETLVNKGMMLSPWFPPRYLWAALEGAAGLDLSSGQARLQPQLSPDWKWLAVRNLPYHDRRLAWLTLRMPDTTTYANHRFADSAPHDVYDEDISPDVHVSDMAVEGMGLRRGGDLLLFAGNTSEHTATTGLRVEDHLSGAYRRRTYDSLAARWRDDGTVSADELRGGINVQTERKGFVLLELTHQ